MASRYLLAEKAFDNIDLFEQRAHVGGVWNQSSVEEKRQRPIDIPHINAHTPPDEPIWRPETAGPGGKEATFISPLYDGLETNIPKSTMGFSDLEFPDHVPLFPSSQDVHDYLAEYSKDIQHLIHLETQVENVRLHDPSAATWSVRRRNLKNNHVTESIYDAVVAASGHYAVPYIPAVPGLEEWNRLYPGVVLHSKSYQSPDAFRDKKVIVVGNSASGIDIGRQVGEACRKPLLTSIQSPPAMYGELEVDDRLVYPEIEEFLLPSTSSSSSPGQRAVRFKDGTVESDIDAILYCTGYFYCFPFLESLDPPVVTDGRRVHQIYDQIFYIPQPTLVFPVMAQRVIPFPTAENQAAVFSRVWSGRLHLPSQQDMAESERETVAERGSGTSFHVLPFPLDVDYNERLYQLSASAKPRPALENDGLGKQCNHFGPRERWLREHIAKFKVVFTLAGEKRNRIRTIEDLGFSYGNEHAARL